MAMVDRAGIGGVGVGAMLIRSLVPKPLEELRVRFVRLLNKGRYGKAIRIAVDIYYENGDGVPQEVLAGLLLEREDYQPLRELALATKDPLIRADLFIELAKRGRMSSDDGANLRELLGAYAACRDLDVLDVASTGTSLLELARLTRAREYLEAAREVAARLSRRKERMNASCLYAMIGGVSCEWSDFRNAEMVARQIREPQERTTVYEILIYHASAVIRPDHLALYVPMLLASIPREAERSRVLFRLGSLLNDFPCGGQA